MNVTELIKQTNISSFLCPVFMLLILFYDVSINDFYNDIINNNVSLVGPGYVTAMSRTLFANCCFGIGAVIC